jgi:hypothetical protein
MVTKSPDTTSTSGLRLLLKSPVHGLVAGGDLEMVERRARHGGLRVRQRRRADRGQRPGADRQQSALQESAARGRGREIDLRGRRFPPVAGLRRCRRWCWCWCWIAIAVVHRNLLREKSGFVDNVSNARSL